MGDLGCVSSSSSMLSLHNSSSARVSFNCTSFFHVGLFAEAEDTNIVHADGLGKDAGLPIAGGLEMAVSQEPSVAFCYTCM